MDTYPIRSNPELYSSQLIVTLPEHSTVCSMYLDRIRLSSRSLTPREWRFSNIVLSWSSSVILHQPLRNSVMNMYIYINNWLKYTHRKTPITNLAGWQVIYALIQENVKWELP